MRLNRKGMTLIEVVVAIAIFGIFMVTLFPAFLIMNLTNIVSMEKTDASFVAQNVIEYIYNYSQTTSFSNTQAEITGSHGYVLVSDSDNVYVYSKIEDDYTVTVSFAINNPSQGLVRVLVVVDANVHSGGQRSQLETIVGFKN